MSPTGAEYTDTAVIIVMTEFYQSGIFKV